MHLFSQKIFLAPEREVLKPGSIIKCQSMRYNHKKTKLTKRLTLKNKN